MLPTIPHQTSDYLPRYIDIELDDLLTEARALALDGAKGVGKTETARRRCDTTFLLDEPETAAVFVANMNSSLESANTVFIDEWQKVPQVWDNVRRRVDAGTQHTYLLAGSATPQKDIDTHSGAGRILSLHMRPLSLAERADTRPTVFIADLFNGDATIEGESTYELRDYAEAITSTGLPGIYDLQPRIRRKHIESYIVRAIDKDLPEAGISVRKPESVRAWWAAYAAASSTTSTYTKILNAATAGMSDKISKDAALAYRDHLASLWLIDAVPARFPSLSPIARLTSTPKHQVLDPGIAAALINATPEILLSGRAGTFETFGQLFESLATLTVRAAGAAVEARTFHLRTRAGDHEIDLLLERYDGSVIAFEVKLAPLVDDSDVKHLHWLREQLGEKVADTVVITTGTRAYRRQDGIAVVPLSLLG